MNFWRYTPRWFERWIFRKVYRIEIREICETPPIISKIEGKIIATPGISKLIPVRMGPGRYWWQFWKKW